MHMINRPNRILIRPVALGLVALGTVIFAVGCGVDLDLTELADRLQTSLTETSRSTEADELSPPPLRPPRGEPCVTILEPAESNHLDMFRQLNEYRRQNGLGELQYSATLELAADLYAVKMKEQDFFSHTAPDGTGPSDRALAAGFCNAFVGENLAFGLNTVSTPTQAMKGFKTSPGHNDNMLNPNWDYVGVGYFRSANLLGAKTWWVQLFGRDID